MLGLDKIVEFLLGLIEKLLPCWQIDEYERGVLLWLGKPTRKHLFNTKNGDIKTIMPGFYLKVPFLHKLLYDIVVTTTLPLQAQSLTTKDGKSVVVKGIIKYSIADIRPFMLTLTDRVDALSDVSQGRIKEQIESRTWEQCNDGTLDNEILKKIRIAVRKWGIEAEEFTMTSQTEAPSYRIFNDPIITQMSHNDASSD